MAAHRRGDAHYLHGCLARFLRESDMGADLGDRKVAEVV